MKERILIACEFSGIARDAFLAQGYNAISCDLLPSEKPGPHIQADVRSILNEPWDMVIAHPPCTDLAVSGARHFAQKRADGTQQKSIDFFMLFTKLPHVQFVCIENPVCIMSSFYRKPDQIIQPWQYGHGETKATCLWLKGLPPLLPTNEVTGRENRIHKMPPSKDRGKNRSKSYPGIAAAMANQWGSYLQNHLMMTTGKPTPLQIELMQHAVGMGANIPRRRWGYRNMYITLLKNNEEDELQKELLSLVSGGYCSVRKIQKWYAGEDALLFSVTQKGCAEIGLGKAATARALDIKGGRA